MTEYERPNLTEEDLKQAREDAHKLIRKYGMGNLLAMLTMLVIENVKLTKEIQEHRAARGIAPLPTFEV